jgi:MFS family permease
VAIVSASTRNFRLMLVYRTTQHSPLYWPYMFLLVTNVRGLPASDFGLLKSIYYFAVMAAEVPLGVVADRLGRKSTLVLGALANACGCALYVGGRSFAIYAIAELCFALTTALQSGAESALLFDGYAAEGRQAEFARATGTLEAVGLAGATVAFALAGLLVTSDGDPTYTYLGTAILSGVGALAALAFVEPPRVSTLRLRAHVAETLRDLARTRGLLATFAYAALVYAALRAANALVWNPVLADAAVPVAAYGALTAVVTLLGALTAWRAHAFERRFGAAPLAFAIAGSLVAMYALLALSPGAWAAPLVTSHGIPLGVAPVLIVDLLNRRITVSERRATLLSFESLFQRGLYGAIVYFAASALDREGLTTVLVGFALLSAVSLALVPRMSRL